VRFLRKQTPQATALWTRPPGAAGQEVGSAGRALVRDRLSPELSGAAMHEALVESVSKSPTAQPHHRPLGNPPA